MATWQQILTHIEANSDVLHKDESSCAVELGNPKTGRSQVVYVNYFADRGSVPATVKFCSPIGKRAELRKKLDTVLDYSQGDPFGISAIGEYLALVHTAFADTIDAPEIDYPMMMIATLADDFEERFTRADDL